ncbi:PAS domain-containing protein [Mesorhizobium sp. NBSH29]|uniref:PAS domain-containing protein n=1 Tax=Mesorhizobium sp. NBSH29 TaxID=2654249 RepID=UPI0018969803|nr:PAS domain-containing protein [Mesorhizobium sp. NBSH29]QPC88729.1 PAS domain-containing protein [Mesorhizobium sp. NBSH29]
MKQNETQSLFQYWDRLRADRIAPLRTDIEPADIKKLLADTFILEKDARGEAVFRLAGTRLCATYGRELKGFSFISLWKEKDQRLVRRLSQNVFSSQSVVVLTFEGVSREGRTSFFELLLLPLDGGSANPRCLGIVSALKKTYWLGTDPIVEAALEAVRVIDPAAESTRSAARHILPVPTLAPDTSALTADADSARSNGRRFRHLVVLDGGRGG